MELKKLNKVGSGKDGILNLNYKQVVERVFEPNVTELDDPSKVLASWGVIDGDGREAFIWSYKFYGNIEDCNIFSVCGDENLLKELFTNNVHYGN